MSARVLKGIIALTVSAALVAGCSSGPRKPSPRALKQIDRALERAPGKAQPSTIVKTELAFSRELRDGNAKQAFIAFAAPGAMIHTDKGVSDAQLFLSDVNGRDLGPQLDTQSVWMSCDGSTAVSQGRLTENGKIGDYAIVWERQPNIRPNGEEETGYRYVYFTSAPDDPQPPARPPAPEPQPGDIVVQAIDAVRADIATCAPREEIALNALAEPADGVEIGSDISRDRTLQWEWYHASAAKHGVSVSLWRKESRETVFTLDLPSAP